ncbi:hypothetical protein [Streptomyces sp. NRRL B-24572]|uniref:hypothetical protein n=1 Tax=Streptomyces sp. NRRL B-24572 TaxID=1962156 RepID=UPI000A37C500|nr:hypothetical protein [Streptomyces sp. NRRL B-24572]
MRLGPAVAALHDTFAEALADDASRAVVAHRLKEVGRVLLSRGHHGVTGYTSGYDDAAARHMADSGIGILPEADRAVLAIALWTIR